MMGRPVRTLGRWFLAVGACVPRTRRRRRFGHRVPVSPDFLRGETGPPRLRRRPSVARAEVVHPAGRDPALAHRRSGPLLPSRAPAFSASGTCLISWPHSPGPTLLRAYASTPALPLTLQGISLPARAGSPLAGRASHPLDDKWNFMKSSHSSFLSKPHSLDATRRTNCRTV